jgi:acyl-CoA hydrolase
MDTKTVSDSAIFEQINSEDLNGEGSFFEGKFFQIAHSLAGIVAQRHTGYPCTVQFINSVRFINPFFPGDMLIGKASVNRTWLYSLEVGIKIVAEDLRTLEEKDILSAYFTLKAFDEDHHPIEIEPIITETAEQIQRFEDAEVRRRHCLNFLPDDELVRRC